MKQARHYPCSVYVHIPYCVRKCPYCDFNSYAVEAPQQNYVDALIRELAAYAQLPEWSNRECLSVFFGGGTPSIFSSAQLCRVIEAVSKFFRLSEKAEITLEANPGTLREKLDSKKLRQLKEGGFNRISLGVQSFSERKLAVLERIHSASDSISAAESLCATGFSNISFDLMFGVCGESMQEWLDDLNTAVSLSPQHISAYSLSIEPGTPFHQRFERRQLPIPEESLQAEMFLRTEKFLSAHGYARYEISNYALPAFCCTHNLGYWSSRDFLGLGAGAHSYLRNRTGSENLSANAIVLSGLRWANVSNPQEYIESVNKKGDACDWKEKVDRNKAEIEFLMLGLRQSTGVKTKQYQELFGDSFETHYSAVAERLSKDELVVINNDSLQLTTKGFLFADSVLQDLLRYRVSN